MLLIIRRILTGAFPKVLGKEVLQYMIEAGWAYGLNISLGRWTPQIGLVKRFWALVGQYPAFQREKPNDTYTVFMNVTSPFVFGFNSLS